MKKNVLLILLICVSSLGFSQNDNDTSKIQLKDITVSFFTSYYEQDGNHSPVTGGIGTEELKNIAPSVSINIPLDTVKSLSINGGVDFYSSASSDNINNPYNDPNHVSGASAKDARSYVVIGYKKKNNQKHTSKGFNFGVSSEYDVTSVSGGVSYSKSSKDENKTISFKANYYLDVWRLIYPIELRNGTNTYLPTDKRHSLNLSSTGSINVNKKLAMSLTTDFVLQSGLLSTPFHRVYFNGLSTAVVEQLPNLRVKLPIGLRTNYYINDFLRFRLFYRFYTDSWGMTGNTINLELPIKISNTIRVSPFFRYHTQTGARYFGEYQTLNAGSEFFTSDFDLSNLSSNKYGIAFNYNPLFGLGRFKGVFRKKKITMFKSIDFRYAYYERSDGLKANVFTLGLNFTLQNRSINSK